MKNWGVKDMENSNINDFIKDKLKIIFDQVTDNNFKIINKIAKSKSVEIEFSANEEIVKVISCFYHIISVNILDRVGHKKKLNENSLNYIFDLILKDFKLHILAKYYDQLSEKYKKKKFENSTERNMFYFKVEELNALLSKFPDIPNKVEIIDYIKIYAKELVKWVPKYKWPMYIYSLYITKIENEKLYLPERNIITKSLKLKYTRSDRYDTRAEYEIFESSIKHLIQFQIINDYICESSNLNKLITLKGFNDVTKLYEINQLAKSFMYKDQKISFLLEKASNKKIENLEELIELEMLNTFNLKTNLDVLADEFYLIKSHFLKMYLIDECDRKNTEELNLFWAILGEIYSKGYKEIDAYLNSIEFSIEDFIALNEELTLLEDERQKLDELGYNDYLVIYCYFVFIYKNYYRITNKKSDKQKNH